MPHTGKKIDPEDLLNKELLYDEAPCGFLSFLPGGTIVNANNTLLAWLGYNEEDIVQVVRFQDLISKGNNIHFEMYFRPLITVQGQAMEINYELKKKDGGMMPVLVNATAFRQKDGQILLVNVAITPISDRLKYENELLHAKKRAEAEKKRYTYLTNQLPGIVFTANDGGEIDYLNERFFQYIGLMQTSFTRQLLVGSIALEDRQQSLHNWREGIRSGNEFHFQLRLLNKEQQAEWHTIRAVPYRNDETIIAKWFASCFSIQEQMDAMERKDEFINLASHELKTPITSLKGFLQLMELSQDPGQVKSYVGKALFSVANLQFLVSNLLDVDIINSGRLTLDRTRCSLLKITESCISQLSDNFSTHQIELLADEGEPFFVNADKHRLVEVILNLLNNAIKYSPGENRVIVSLQRIPGDLVKLSIRDFGIGIPDHVKDEIFKKYFRVTNDLTSSPAGLGLGLYIIQNILQKHHSKVNVNNNFDKGVEFSFSLPIC